MKDAVLDSPPTVSDLTRELQEHGIAVVPDLFTKDQLAGMRRAFESRLKRLRFSDVDGYEKTEPYRHMVHDVLTLDQGFVDAALDRRVQRACREYVGPEFALTEAKGWLSLPTRRDFHGWHGDMWYDQTKVQLIPRELKLAFYLTDVTSGAFAYVRGSHQKQHPRNFKREEVADIDPSRIVELTGPAGTAFLFDTSGVHRQSYPILEPRMACFYNYHDPGVPLQREDVEYYRYHPLLLNAAFLGGLTEEDMRVLGFGDKRNYVPAFARQPRGKAFVSVVSTLHDARLRWDELAGRVAGRLRRLFGR